MHARVRGTKTKTVVEKNRGGNCENFSTRDKYIYFTYESYIYTESRKKVFKIYKIYMI